ncbi:OB-fold domain-containing protein [Gemmobacter sp.]|uniref:Zn-ribbon domain-containing OB-fold protein n=1 Tax=Gemmobacter sp. TaxID=1898957 RepID=UPI002AFE499B|nr:OB-fold domain-containing protein [Gemmobacter sp.]
MGQTRPYLSVYDEPLWAGFEQDELRLQKGSQSGKFRYPPSPLDPDTLEMVPIEDLASEFETVSGKGEIYSWCVFHRQYFDDKPVPYNVITVKLDEGPYFVSNLVGDMPEGELIGRRVEAVYEPYQGRKIIKFRLAE